MSKIVAGAIGFVAGAVTGYVVPSLISKPASLPSDITEILNTLTFMDLATNQTYQNRKVLLAQKNGDWDTWLIGYGPFGGPNSPVPNDILVDLGRNNVTKEVSATISKLGWNSVLVMHGNISIATLAAVSDWNTPALSQVAIKLLI